MLEFKKKADTHRRNLWVVFYRKVLMADSLFFDCISFPKRQSKFSSIILCKLGFCLLGKN